MKPTARLCTLLAALALFTTAPAALHAQQTFNAPLTVNGTSPATFDFRADGTLISKGQSNPTTTLPASDEGGGIRLLWFPARWAFRAGAASCEQWATANIGYGSAAFGDSTLASGARSVAAGAWSEASGFCSVAMGSSAYASGSSSLAVGEYATATGTASVALGASTTGGQYATALGASWANGNYATAVGRSNDARAYVSFVAGRYNLGGGDPQNWVPTDPLFELGNGTNWAARSNALTVYKNGNAKLQGTLVVAPGGDIPMFSGN